MQPEEDAMKIIRWMIPVCGMGLAGAGCISMPKMLPAEYFTPTRTITVAVADCAETPVLRTDQPQGGVAGATWLTRNEAMRNRLSGIKPEMIQRAVEQELAKQLAGTFNVVAHDAQLGLEVSINEWGWYVPTGTYGESIDIHFFRLGGTATIVDLAPAQNGAEVYHAYNSTDTPIGDRLTKEKCEAALPKAAEEFAAQIVRFILKGQAP
jgi:hypothetical protein